MAEWREQRDRAVTAHAEALLARLLGSPPLSQDPRLIVGEGARDGESMPLAVLLRKRLD